MSDSLRLVAAIAVIFSVIDTSAADWDQALFNTGIVGSTGDLMVMITEDGLLRGWLWASLKGNNKSDRQILIGTTLAFVS